MANKAGTAGEKWSFPNIIDWLTFGKVGDSDAGSAFRKVQDIPEAVQIDDTGTYIYMGWAIPGSSTGDSVWRIARIDTNGNKLWADGNALYDNEYDNRASLSYS